MPQRAPTQEDEQIDALAALLPEGGEGAAPPRAEGAAPATVGATAATRKVSQGDWERLADLFPAREPTMLEKASIAAGRAVADLAKYPEIAAEATGISADTIKRHTPAIASMAEWGRNLQRAADEAEDPRLAAQDLGSQLARGVGSMLPLAAAAPLGGAAGQLIGRGGAIAAQVGSSLASALTGAAQTAVPMYEDVLAETGDPDKAWAAFALGHGIGATEAVGLGRILGRIDRAGAGSLKKALTRLAVEASEEALQEYVQTFAQDAAEAKLTGKELNLVRELQASGEGALVGALLGGGVSGGIEGLGAARGALGRKGGRGGRQGPGQPTDVPRKPADQGGKSIEQISREARALPAGVSGESPGQPRLRSETSVGGEPAPSAQSAAAGTEQEAPTRSPEEAAQALLAGEELPLAEMTPEVVQHAIRLRDEAPPEGSPDAAGPAPAPEAQAEGLQAEQEPATSAAAPGELTERRKGALELRPEDIEAEEGLKEVAKRVPRAVAGDIAPMLVKEADEDPKTGLMNARADEEWSQRVIRAQRKRKGTRAVRIAADLRDLTSINNLFGHEFGDQVMRDLADAWRGVARTGDARPARTGGDEFSSTILIGEDADPEAIVARIEKAADEVMKKHGLGEPIQGRVFGVDAGWAEVLPGIGDPLEALKHASKRADEMATSRKQSRNPGKRKLTAAEYAEMRPTAIAAREARLAAQKNVAEPEGAADRRTLVAAEGAGTEAPAASAPPEVGKPPAGPTTEGETPSGARSVRGVHYWKDRAKAIEWAQANGWPTDRVIEYEKGHAVQSGKSGNYAGPGESPREFRGQSDRLPDLRGEATGATTELLAFPGSVGPDIRNAVDAIARRLGAIRGQRAIGNGIIPTEDLTELMIRKLQDSFRGIKKTQEAVGITDADEDIDAYLQEELRRGKTKTRLERLDSDIQRPLLKHLRQSGISPEEFGEALMARHARERNAAIRQIDKSNDAGSGMTDAEADAIMQRVSSGKRAADFETGFELMDKLTAEVRAGWVRDGLKSQEEVDALAKKYKYYVPLRSDLSEGEEGARATSRTGRGVDVRGKEFQAATGRSTKADAKQVLAYAITQAQQAIVRGEKARVGQSFLGLMRAFPEAFMGFAEESPAQTRRAVVNGMVRQVFDPTVRLADNAFLVKEGGKDTLVLFDPDYQHVADGLKNLGADNSGRLVQHLGGFTRYLAAVSTRWNPVFPLFNAIRDAAGAFINSGEHGLAFASRTIKDIPAAMWALSKHKAGKGGGLKWDKYAKEYAESGARVSFLDLSSFEDHLRRIEKDAKAEAKVGAIGSTLRGWRELVRAIESANDIVENAVRFSAYVHAREDLGMTEARAASWAKNLTVNFERKGDLGAMVNALWMFANAGIQSTARVGQAIRHPAVRRLLVAAFMGSMAWDQIMRAIGGKDDDGEDNWDKIPSHIKRHNLVFMYPDGSGRSVTIPTPFVYDWIQTAAQQLSATISGDAKPGAALGETASSAVEAIDPIGSGRLDLGDPASIARAVSPTVLDPLVELATNRDWKGDPIVYDKYKVEGAPDSEDQWPVPSATSKAAAQWLNKHTGGDSFEKGEIDVSPQTLDHLGAFLTGGLGRTLAQMWDVSAKKSGGESVEMRDIPLVSRLIREPSRFASTDDFHKLQEALRIEKDRAKAEHRLMPGDLGRLYKEASHLETSRRKRRKEIDQLNGDARRIAEEALDTELQKFNARVRRALLTEDH